MIGVYIDPAKKIGIIDSNVVPMVGTLLTIQRDREDVWDMYMVAQIEYVYQQRKAKLKTEGIRVFVKPTNMGLTPTKG